MTRIISGAAGGRRIAVPPKGTRPTTDRVREAIFSRLDHGLRVRGARVLDAFAGSGALGLEALSRGAEWATFVESDARAAAAIRANAQSLGYVDRSRVVRERVRPWLERSEAAFDLALVDPPYDLDPAELAGTLNALVPRLAPGAVVVLEWSSRAGAPAWPDGLAPEATKVYGETTVHYATASGAEARGRQGSPSDSLDT